MKKNYLRCIQERKEQCLENIGKFISDNAGIGDHQDQILTISLLFSRMHEDISKLRDSWHAELMEKTE